MDEPTKDFTGYRNMVQVLWKKRFTATLPGRKCNPQECKIVPCIRVRLYFIVLCETCLELFWGREHGLMNGVLWLF